MNAPDEVKRLIERFDNHREEYLSGKYNETQLRREFLDPFWTALGWDVENRQGVSATYKDVIHEDAIKVGSATKAPDYSFRIGPQRKFFLEAKKPSLTLKDEVSPAFQLRRYAWSAKLPLSILSDFEEFAVYDCRVKPLKNDKASTARFQYLTYQDYVPRWEEIHSVFSRDAVWNGSFDKYVVGSKGKKGTDEVDDAFLKEIESWRDILARNIAIRNGKLSQHELNFAVQRTIDRIIFLRICEDRGIETYGALQALLNGERIYKRMCELFYRADEKYNSGLFHFNQEKGRPEIPDEFTLGLHIDDKVLKDIVGGLYYPDCPYEFSVLPADILGQVYEQFLGKVIRLTKGHQAKVEEKPEVRKAGGVYYTPTYIVDYIVKNTVGKLAEGKTPKEVSKLRILDPACGSGSFLIGAYQFLLDWHRDWYVRDGEEKWSTGKNATLYRGPGGDWRLSTAERKRILLNNIYGVDIDTQAVEVTKLSLLLKVLEGENEESINQQLKMFHERALPDLGSNIKCGNSLIGPDFYEGKQLGLLDEDQRNRINVFDWRSEFKEIMDAGGFHAVVGNPPYVRIQRIEHSEADYIFEKFSSAASKTDLSTIFIEKGLGLTRGSGRLGFISTSQWISTDYGKGVRRLLSSGKIVEIVNFGSLPVFRDADTYPAVLILSPKENHATFALRTITAADQLNMVGIESAIQTIVKFSSLNDKAWNLGAFDLIAFLSGRNIPFAEFSTFGGALIGALTGMDEAFVVARDEAKQRGLEDNLLFPYAYRGAEVRAYSMVSPHSLLVYPYSEGSDGNAILIPEAELKRSYPHVFSHLVQRKEVLRKRKDSRRLYADGKEWYRYLRPGRFEYIRPSKLIIKGIDTKTTVGLLKEDTAFNGANCPAIILSNTRGLQSEYFLGILNSALISFYLRQVCPPKLGGYFRFNANSINRIPIRLLDVSIPNENALHTKMVQLVEAMLRLQADMCSAITDQEKTAFKRQIDATDKQIDALVYELYGLTDEEMKIVESGLASSKPKGEKA